MPLSSPRFCRCGCDPSQTQTFSPLTGLLTEHTTPELLYLETKWASLVSYGMSIDLLKDVLPIAATASAATDRNHLHKVAKRRETELGDERRCFIEGCPADWEELPIPEGPIIVGIDGGYVRSWENRKNNFEVIVGKSVPEDREHRYFGLVQTHDDKPKRRLFEFLRDQGFKMNQDITFLTDGGDSLRRMISPLALSTISTGSTSPCASPCSANSSKVWLIMSHRKPPHWKTASLGSSGGFGTATAARL